MSLSRAFVMRCVACCGLLLSSCTMTSLLLGGGSIAASRIFKPPMWKQNAFVGSLFRATQSDTSNFALSPFGLASVLSMAYIGATNETALCMATALQINDRQDDVAGLFKDYYRGLEQISYRDGIHLTLSNSIWPRKGFAIQPKFVQAAYLGFKADVISIPMDNSGVAQINDYVMDKTHNRIANFLSPPLDPSTELILINTLFFKGQWKRKFDVSDTYPEAFKTPSGTVETDFLHRSGAYDFVQAPTYTALYLPYEGEMAEMILILPNPDADLSAVTKELGRGLLKNCDSTAEYQQVDVSIPKFSIRSSLNLAEPLVNMGMGVAFSQQAEFTGISTNSTFFISQVIQEVQVDVDEEGTEAAAATALMSIGGLPPRPSERTFKADRPFLFVLREKTSKLILLVGQVVDPSPHAAARTDSDASDSPAPQSTL